METELTKRAELPGVLCFVMPFASPGSVKHGRKLIDCLAPNSHHLFVVGDERLRVNGQPASVVYQGRLPSLHYLAGIQPLPWSAILWVLKLIWIFGRASWAVFETRHQVDVVICFLGAYYTPILLCARLLGKKVIAFLPNSDAELARLTYRRGWGKLLVVGLLQLLQRVNHSLAHVCVVESLGLVAPIRLQPYRDKVRVGNLYVNTELYQTHIPFEQRSQVLGFIGRLSPGKGIMELLAAAAVLHGRGLTFQIIGDGPLWDAIEAALQQPELSHVKLTRWADDKSVIEYLNSFRLLVLPTDSEGLPNVVLEAMACGTPVLATAVGGIPDLIQPYLTGFSLPDQNPATIARSVHEALNHRDLGAIARRGQQHVRQHYALAASTKKWAEILDELTTKIPTQPQLV